MLEPNLPVNPACHGNPSDGTAIRLLVLPRLWKWFRTVRRRLQASCVADLDRGVRVKDILVFK